MVVVEINVEKQDGSSGVYKLIPRHVVESRRQRNLKGLKPAVSYSNQHRPKQQAAWNLKNKWPGIYDQRDIGSCTANAFCGIYKYLQHDKTFDPSRLYVYYKERLLENPNGPIEDSGAWIIDGYRWVHDTGVCSERSWPYDTSNVNVAPPKKCDDEAPKHKANWIYPIRMDDSLHNTIAWAIVQNNPVAMAFGVYASFMKIGRDGLCPVPNLNDPTDSYQGGHEVVIVGYDDAKRLYTVANSWGNNWGDGGFFYMPYEFLENKELIYDFCIFSVK